MPLNLDVVGSTFGPVESSWTATDCLLYALGVGAGSVDPAAELEFTTENSTDIAQKVLPTFASVAAWPPERRALSLPTSDPATPSLGSFDPAMVVHAEQSVEVFGPLPTDARIRSVTRVIGIDDMISGALLTLETTSVDLSTGLPLFRTAIGLFVRGEGGCGGRRRQLQTRERSPSRTPDEVVTYATRGDQALLYRLVGDRNPLHSDPSFARRAGFDRPILHGLCTYGIAGRALLHSVCQSDPAGFRSMYGRFRRPVYPGDTLSIAIWEEDAGVLFRVANAHGHVVMASGSCTMSQRSHVPGCG
jgi:acyl dehydratase